ncbi:M16 family metallopeptidase [Azospirillum thermophilum]|uniref:Peptidase M16 n=1 Tax=Azospirillum thermophilum TaxID=2202148 RepID=A0A2S2CM56_9PROT|nr:pitrilysin family protein [Azospirillum thermophilum]AWK85593.1 peptidase M16 [Azospirillum thermophilum]
MSSVRVTTLPNGLRVATDSMPDVQSVSLGCWVGVGTRNETAEVNGVAHLVEHMLFKGTERRSAFRISEEIENVGGQLNAYTTREQTAYYAKVLHEDTALAVDLIADMLQNSALDEEELGRERAVVLQEIGQSVDTPDDIIFDHFQATAYPNQAIGRPVLGSAEIVGALPRSALIDYIHGNYGGPSLVLAAAGRIEHDRMVELAEKAFSGLSDRPAGPVEPARYAGGDYREIRDLEQLHLVLGFDGVGVHDPDFYAHSVLSTLLGGGMSSRLFQEVREKRGLVYSIYTFTGGYGDGGLFGVYAGTGEEEATELLPVVCDEIVKVGATVTEEEVARARAQLKAGTLMSLESSMSRCEQLGQQLLIYDRPVPVEEIVRKIDAVDRAAVVAAAERLRASRPTVAAIGPVGRLEDYDRIAARLS